MKNQLMLLVVLFMICAPCQAADKEMVTKIVACESSGVEGIWGDDHRSFGIAQFQRSTFIYLRRRAEMPGLQWDNSVDQIVLLAWALDHGWGKLWTCYRMIVDDGWTMNARLTAKMKKIKPLNIALGREELWAKPTSSQNVSFSGS